MIHKMPKTLKVKDKKYQIKLIEGFHNRNTLGMIHYNDRIEIKIKDKNTSLDTLWHEAIHAIVYHYNIDFKKDTEEQIVEKLGVGIRKMIIDNGGGE